MCPTGLDTDFLFPARRDARVVVPYKERQIYIRY